jgi:hypothetical protein
MLRASIIYDFACERTVKSWLPLAAHRCAVRGAGRPGGLSLRANQGCAHQTSAAAAAFPPSFSRAAACRYNKDHRDINKRRFLALLSSFMVDHKPH